jgi:FkbM family methyltransferase
MKFSFKTLANAASQKFNITVISRQRFQRLKSEAAAYRDLELMRAFQDSDASKILQNIDYSKSQIRQDIFALSVNGFKKNGFFVEFGATNGVDLSNSHILEKQFGWSGILAEPGKNWQTELKKNRAANIDTRCVWSRSNEKLQFEECIDPELSTISSFTNSDLKKVSRKTKETYTVETVSLNDLLKHHSAPREIDYLSIDTEGSEFEILNSFDFSKHSFNAITCEHNNSPTREKIFKLLVEHGYTRKFEHLSAFDDWYVKAQS